MAYIRHELGHLYENCLYKTQRACLNGSWLIHNLCLDFVLVVMAIMELEKPCLCAV